MICILGVLKTDDGLAIKDEMLTWLKDHFDVLCIEQEPPGKLFEYPAIKYAIKTAIEMNEPVLYIHTKGAGNKAAPGFIKEKMTKLCSNFPKEATGEDAQQVVRNMWKHEFTENLQAYLDAVNTKEPTVACPYSGKTKTTWFNGFIMNPAAANELSKTFHQAMSRYYYETMFENTSIKVIGIRNNDAVHATRYENLWNDVWTFYTE